MNKESQSLVAIALCVVFYLGYTQYLQRKYPEMKSESSVSETTTPEANKAEPTPPTSEPPVAANNPPSTVSAQTAKTEPVNTATKLSDDQLTFENSVLKISFKQENLGIQQIILKDFLSDSQNKQPINILEFPILVQPYVSRTADTLTLGQVSAERKGDQIVFSRQEGPWLIKQVISAPKDDYSMDVRVSFTNTGNQAAELTGGVRLVELVHPAEVPGMLSGKPAGADIRTVNILTDISGSVTMHPLKDLCESAEPETIAGVNENVSYIGRDSHYFLVAMLLKEPKISYSIRRLNTSTGAQCETVIQAFQPYGSVNPNQTTELAFSLYTGPKSFEALEKVSPELKKSINFGWFGIIANPLLDGIKWINGYVHNYGIAIILITAFLKILFYPLTKQAAVSMKRMQALQPEMQKIREKYKSDPQNQQRELMKFMSANKVNPAKGCLPILPQLPVFVALYNVLSQSIELRLAPFMGWIQDLSAQDPYYITPVLLGVFMLIQQKLTPTTGIDKTQERIMMLMPIVFTVMMLSLPSGLVLYMLTNSVISIFQQQWLNKKLGTAAPAVASLA